jgi:hypothetical protein
MASLFRERVLMPNFQISRKRVAPVCVDQIVASAPSIEMEAALAHFASR